MLGEAQGGRLDSVAMYATSVFLNCSTASTEPSSPTDEITTHVSVIQAIIHDGGHPLSFDVEMDELRQV